MVQDLDEKITTAISGGEDPADLGVLIQGYATELVASGGRGWVVSAARLAPRVPSSVLHDAAYALTNRTRWDDDIASASFGGPARPRYSSPLVRINTLRASSSRTALPSIFAPPASQ